jgi:two-component system response regulator QseB
LCILDLTLPEVDGMVVIASARAAGKATPILILSARDSVSDRIKGLNLGADDYLVKPFDIEELIARMRVLERRSSGASTNIINYKNLLLDLSAMTLHYSGILVELQPNEFKLMRKLIENPSLILSRDQLEECLYGWGGGVESNTVSVYIHNIRKKICADVIRTVRGIGYRAG